MKQKCDEPSFKDPVCSMEVSHKTAAEAFDYAGQTYYFCAKICREAFEAEPALYMSDQHQHRLRHGKIIG